MKQRHDKIIIDGALYTSTNKVGTAFGVTPQLVSRRIRRYGRTKLTSQELLSSTWVDSSIPTMSWDFVYRQISSSPRNQSVDSTAVLHTA